MSQLGTSNPDWDLIRSSSDEDVVRREVRTKQSFKDQCDINKILKKAQKAGGLAHVNKYPAAVYGEFEGYDLLEAFGKVNRANEIFADLPSEVRNEFENDALKFAGWASDPQNNARLLELLPKIAEPGAFFPNPRKRTAESAAVEESTETAVTDPPATSEEPPPSS